MNRNWKLLTPQQKLIVEYVRQGLSNTKIAAILEVGAESIKTQLQRMYEKFKVHGRGELIFYLTAIGYFN